mgnify:CR=1 FL=1
MNTETLKEIDEALAYAVDTRAKTIDSKNTTLSFLPNPYQYLIFVNFIKLDTNNATTFRKVFNVQ